jgi:hypothetical protein
LRCTSFMVNQRGRRQSIASANLLSRRSPECAACP